MKAAGIASLMVFLMSRSAYACSVCFGSTETLATKSLNAGVLSLIGVITFVLAGIAYTAFTWMKRAQQLENY